MSSNPPPPRLQSLDAFRGFTVAAMLLVNNPGTWGAIWWPLEHAEWHGWTPTDLIFPFFLFIVGITTELSRKVPRLILKRGVLIILCGLLLHAFPFFRLDTLRFMGVLQRIGIVYIISALIAYKASRRTIFIITSVILVGYWAVLSLGPLEPPDATIAAQVDRALIGTPHLWKQAKTWDPEGPLSTIGAVATALLGVLVAPWVRARNVKMLTIAGAIGIAVGLAWGQVFPINKSLWTSSYVVFTAGCAAVLLSLFLWIIDVRRAERRGQRAEGQTGTLPLPSALGAPLSAPRWATPLIVFGVNPLLAFLGTGVMARLLGLIKVGGVSLHTLSYRTFFRPYFEPHVASFLWALAFIGVWLVILWMLYRKGIVLKV